MYYAIRNTQYALLFTFYVLLPPLLPLPRSLHLHLPGGPAAAAGGDCFFGSFYVAALSASKRAGLPVIPGEALLVGGVAPVSTSVSFSLASHYLLQFQPGRFCGPL